MQERWKVTAWLGGLWFFVLLYGENLAFVFPAFSSTWPPLYYEDTRLGKTEKTERIALIADPQLTDRTTHGMALGSVALRLIQFYSDIYMLRAFRSAVLGTKPDRVIFLGDYFDGGVDISQDEWRESARRFEHIFQKPLGASQWRYGSNVPVHYLSGNHDLGYVQTHTESPEVLEQYESFFGSTNFRVRVGGVEFIFVNAQVLDGPESDVQTNRSWSFIQQVAADSKPPARVLLTHIPLHRPDDTPCGPHRGSPVINQRIRRMPDEPHRILYQNYLTKETSEKLLATLNPIAVFSGHDHDQCETTHTVSGHSYVEHTVGTFSWQNGNIFPSFMLVTVAPSAPASDKPLLPLVNSSLCFLPVQLLIYVWYGILFVVSIVAVFAWPAKGVHLGISWEQFRSYVRGILSVQGQVKEKVDLDNEWEMVWDAEGAMHLLSKAQAKIPDSSQGLSSDVRGSAQARPAAKRVPINDSDAKPAISDDQNFSGVRRIKSRGRSCLRKFVRGIGPFAALVSWAFGFYVILLMKDWSDTEGDRAFV